MLIEAAMKLKPGEPIIYVPNHANGNPMHPDCERGYVERVADNGVVFCRFDQHMRSIEENVQKMETMRTK